MNAATRHHSRIARQGTIAALVLLAASLFAGFTGSSIETTPNPSRSVSPTEVAGR